jgi:hypothetical protein
MGGGPWCAEKTLPEGSWCWKPGRVHCCRAAVCSSPLIDTNHPYNNLQDPATGSSRQQHPAAAGSSRQCQHPAAGSSPVATRGPDDCSRAALIIRCRRWRFRPRCYLTYPSHMPRVL